MPTKHFDKSKCINLLFFIAFGILLYSAALTYQQIVRSLHTNSWIMHTRDVISEADIINFNLTDIESRVNLYLISQDTEVIKDLPKLDNEIDSSVKNLKTLTQDNPQQQSRIRVLEPLIKEKLTFKEKILAIDKVDKQNALKMSGSNKRIELKNEISSIISNIKHDELKLLKARSASYQDNIYRSAIQLLFSVLFAGLIFLSSILLLNYYSKKRKQSENIQYSTEKMLFYIVNNVLQQSEERYLLATEGSHVGLWDWLPGTNEVYYSPYLKKMLGYTDKEFTNSLDMFLSHIHTEDIGKVWNLINAHLNYKTPYRIEYRLRTKHGKYKWFQDAAQAIWDESGKPIRMSGSIIDINDKKMAEARLNAQYEIIRSLSEDRELSDTLIKIIQAIYKILPCDVSAVWLLNEDTKLLKCAYYWQINTQLGHAFEKVSKDFSLNIGEGIVGHVYQTKEPVFIPNILKNNHFIRKKEAEQLGLKSGYFIPILNKEYIHGVLEIYTIREMQTDSALLNLLFYTGFLIGEYLERYHATRELYENEVYKTAILESALEGIITIDVHGTVKSVNAQTNKMFEYGKESIIGQNINLILPNFTKELTKHVDNQIFEWEGRYKNGGFFPAEIVISSMTLSKQMTYVVIARDISERKKIEKMKNEFISLVSHELRTPLTAIHGALDLILDGTVGDINTEMKELLDIAKQNGERLIRLINDILDIEKIEAGKMDFVFQVIEINLLVNEAIKLNQIYAASNNIFIRRINDNLPPTYVNVDQDRFIQVLTNLLSNAIKFTPQGETVDVEVIKLKHCVRVLVSDKGPGISKEFQSRIFKKFAQEVPGTTRSRGGTGLGLNISKAIIENMHGQINYSTSNKGTSFYFDLPISPVKKDQSVQNHSNLNEKSLDRAIYILYIENDDDLIRVVCRTLQNDAICYSVKTRQAAKEALAKNQFDVVILDIMLADGSSVDLISEIYQKKIPIIVYSAYELPSEYQDKVECVLAKSKTSNKKLEATVKAVIRDKVFSHG